MSKLSALFIVAALLNLLFSNANIIGIDFASDSIKVAIVQPGTPLEIVNNFQSKRKTPTAITFYRDERMFGADSIALMGRKPELTFSNIYRMIGRTEHHPIIQEFKEQYFPYQIYTNDTTGLLSFKLQDTSYTPEELMALILQHIKDMSEAYGGKAIKDCVITIPSSFTQHEREAVYTAADIADLKVLSLIEENTAAALHYSLDRSFDTPTNVMFYNMGAGSTQVTIVQYSTTNIKENNKNKTINSFNILSKAWDSSLGGFNFDIKLAELLAERFNNIWKTKKSYKNNDKINNYILPMTKLKIQANKIKEILSANTEYPIKIEQLYNDIDLNTKITRIEFEEICFDLFNKLIKPIKLALKKANLDVIDLYAVELLGGSVRIPKIKEIIHNYFNNQKNNNDITTTKVPVGQHLNGDEAMAMGAAFKAANLSTAFRVRKIHANDISTYSIGVKLQLLPTDKNQNNGIFSNFFGGSSNSNTKTTTSTTDSTDTTIEEEWTKYTNLYPANTILPAKTKTVAFTHDQDIICRIEYDNITSSSSTDNILPDGTDKLIAMYNITGITSFAKEHANKNLGLPKVHLSFVLDGSGIVSLVKAEATLELPSITTTDTTSITADETDNSSSSTTTTSTDTTTDSNTDSTTSTATDDATTNTDTDNNTTTDKTNDTTTNTSKSKASKKSTKNNQKDRFIRKTLTINNNLHSTKPPKWSIEQILTAKQRRYALKAADDLKKATEASLNELEAYIYRIKNQFLDQEEQLKQISTDKQRLEVIDLANMIEEWLYDEGRNQSIDIYKQKLIEIQNLANLILERYNEITLRKNVLTKAYKQLQTVINKVETWNNEDSNMSHITIEEKEKLLTTITKVQNWLKQKENEQNQASPYEKPVFLSTEVAPQLKTVSTIFEKLLNKPKPVVPKVEKNTTTTDSSNTGDNDTIKVEVQEDANANTGTTTENAEDKKRTEDKTDDEL